jgi:hypothetical protein
VTERQATPDPLAVDLTAVVNGVADDDPRVLVVPGDGDDPVALPAGPLRAGDTTLQAGLRRWVEAQTGHRLGYVEQLYTFGDRAPRDPAAVPSDTARTLSIAYLALTADIGSVPAHRAAWRSWYWHFPWEDWRDGPPAGFDALIDAVRAWAAQARGRGRRERARRTFGLDGAPWDEERALERYELLYEAALVPEAWVDRGHAVPADVSALAGTSMALDHRRILATAISRLRGKIKYRPVLFELLPAEFTLYQLQRTAEALAGVRLHKQNFRRRVESLGLVEDTGRKATDTGGRPARLMRFREEVVQERPAPGVRVHATRRAGYP